ncbi:TPA: hypothetical protein IAA68_01375 [Candidatus Galligastranaerophilus faecipullorum]|nr:hypothetical protein [Candidatus Galligastranaerophilus faecipullorum]
MNINSLNSTSFGGGKILVAGRNVGTPKNLEERKEIDVNDIEKFNGEFIELKGKKGIDKTIIVSDATNMADVYKAYTLLKQIPGEGKISVLPKTTIRFAE